MKDAAEHLTDGHKAVMLLGMASLSDSLDGPSHLARNQDSQLLISTLISVVQSPSIE
tara:strand:- start:89 stop:259 length:171 start_codon:yes stop_codon:yes gene_type:complete